MKAPKDFINALSKKLDRSALLNIGLYTLLAYFSLAFIAYGVAWLGFPKRHDELMKTTDGKFTGIITGWSSSGFGKNKDYVIEINDVPYYAPAEVINPNLDGKEYGIVYLDKDLRKGRGVYGRTRGIKEKIITELNVSEPNKRLINGPKSKPGILTIINDTYLARGWRNIVFGILIFPLFLGIRFGFRKTDLIKKIRLKLKAAK